MNRFCLSPRRRRLSALGGIALAAELDQRPGEPGVPRGVRIPLVEERLDLDVPLEGQEPGDQAYSGSPGCRRD